MPASATSRRCPEAAASFGVCRRASESGGTAPASSQQHVAVGFGLMALLLSTITASIEPAHTHASAASYGGSAGHSEPAYSREPTTGWTTFPEFLRSAFNDRFYDTDSRTYHTMSPNRPANGVQNWLEAVKLAAGRRVKQSKSDEEEEEETEQTLLPDSESAHSRTLSSTDTLTPALDDSSVCVCVTPQADNLHQEGHGESASASHPGDDDSESSLLSSLAQSIVGTAVSFAAHVSSPLQLPSTNEDALALVVATQRMGVSYLPLCPETQCRAAALTRSFVSALPLYAQQPLRFGEVVCIPYPADASRTLCFTGTFRKPTASESAGTSSTPRKNLQDNADLSESRESESPTMCENRADAASNATAITRDGQLPLGPQVPLFRLFVGQLRKETTTGFVEYLLRDIIGVDLHRDVAHIEMHTSGQGLRSKGCAWVDFHTDDAMQRVLQFHKRLFINDSSMWKCLPSDGMTGHNILYEDAAGVATPHVSEEYVVIVDAANSQWLAETAAELAKVNGRGNDVLSRGPIVIEVPQQRLVTEERANKPSSPKKQRKATALAGVGKGDTESLQETALSPPIERTPIEDGCDSMLSTVAVPAKKSKRRRQRKAGSNNNSAQGTHISDAGNDDGEREAGNMSEEEDMSPVCADSPTAGCNINAITSQHHYQPAFFSLVHGAARTHAACELTPNFMPFPWRYDPYHPHNPRVFVVSGCAATE